LNESLSGALQMLQVSSDHERGRSIERAPQARPQLAYEP